MSRLPGRHALLPFMIQKLEHREEHVAEQIWHLQHAAYRVEAELIGTANLPPLQQTVDDIRRLPETFYGILEEECELMAAISVEVEGKTVTICRVMVHPSRFRRGYARRLIAFAEAAHGDADGFRVSAAVNNTPAVRLYESMGYRRIREWYPMPGLVMADYGKNRERSEPNG